MMSLLRYFFLCILLAGSSLQSPAAGRPTARPTRPAEERSLLIYPNPSTGIVHIAINGFEGRRLELRILNVIGTVIYRESITELTGPKTLDLSKFASGLYYVKLEGENASEMRKLVIR